MNFDHATAFIVVGILYLLTPIATWGVLSGRRERATIWWCGGGLLLGASAIWVALSLRHVPWFVYQSVANLLILGGAFLKINTLRSWMGERVYSRSLLIFFPVYLLGGLLIEMALGREVLRWTIVASHAVLYTYLTWLAWRVFEARKWRAVLWIFGGYCMVTATLLILLIDFDNGRPSSWVAGLPAMILSIVGAFSSFINHLGYVGVLLERSRAHETAALVEATKQSERRALMRTITVSERERLLAGLARKLSHELSQPLTSVKSTVRLMSRAQADDRLEQLNFPDLIHRLEGAVGVASGIIDQIRPLAKAHAGVQARLSVRDVAMQAIEILDLNLDRPICLVSAPDPIPDRDSVDASRVELLQVFINLLVNAQQACEAAGVSARIEVSIEVDASTVCFRVLDNGPGFSREALAQIGKVPYSSKDEGMGLGLWLCDEIVRRNGGQLEFSNREEGACVLVRWPRSGERLS